MKSFFMKAKQQLLFTLIALIFTCYNSIAQDVSINLPEDPFVVIGGKPSSIANKANLASYRSAAIFTQLMGELKKESAAFYNLMMKSMDDLESTGINMDTKFYFFVNPSQGRTVNIGFLFNVKDKNKLEKFALDFFNSIQKGFTSEKIGGLTIFSNKERPDYSPIFALNSQKALFLVPDGYLEEGDRRQMLIDEAKMLLNKKNLHSPTLKKLSSSKADISVSVPISSNMINPRMTKEIGINLIGSSFYGDFFFEKGKIRAEATFDGNKEINDFLKENPLFNGKGVNFAPILSNPNNPLVFFSGNINTQTILNYLKRIEGFNRTLPRFKSEFGFEFDDLAKEFDGQASISFDDLKTYDYSYTYTDYEGNEVERKYKREAPVMTIKAKLNSNSKLKMMFDKIAEKEGEKFKKIGKFYEVKDGGTSLYFSIESGMFIFTTNKKVVNGGGNKLSSTTKKNIKSNSLYGQARLYDLFQTLINVATEKGDKYDLRSVERELKPMQKIFGFKLAEAKVKDGKLSVVATLDKNINGAEYIIKMIEALIDQELNRR